jgi:hypothetical protein
MLACLGLVAAFACHAQRPAIATSCMTGIDTATASTMLHYGPPLEAQLDATVRDVVAALRIARGHAWNRSSSGCIPTTLELEVHFHGELAPISRLAESGTLTLLRVSGEPFGLVVAQFETVHLPELLAMPDVLSVAAPRSSRTD